MKLVEGAIPVHCGSKFTWSKTCGLTEASSLSSPASSRVWNDSCDLGFYVKSHRTGKHKLFVYERSTVDDEGEVRYDTYRSTDGFTVKVFND